MENINDKILIYQTADVNTQIVVNFGSTVEVLKPAGLRADMRGEIQEMLNKYQEDDE